MATKKEILTSYFGIVLEDLREWVNEAQSITTKFKTVATVTHITANQLRKINNSISNLKGMLNVLFLAYKDIEKEYELKPLSVQYMSEFSDILKEADSVIEDIKKVANEYDSFVERSLQQKANIDDYITPNNQKSIEFLKTLDTQTLLKILETGHLSGL